MASKLDNLKRPAIEIGKRKRLTKKQREALLIANDRTCHICKEPIAEDDDTWEASHLVNHAFGGKITKPAHHKCHRRQTYEHDIPAVAKAKRLWKKDRGETKPKHKIKSRGFQKGKTTIPSRAFSKRWS